MKSIKILTALAISAAMFSNCGEASDNTESNMEDTSAVEEFVWKTEQFADIKIVRYQIPGFDQLSLDQKKLAYYLTQAGYSGRDIIWDQNYRHNLSIRHALENIVKNYDGDKTSADWENFMTYTKRVWFANGIHHHYGMSKFSPDFSEISWTFKTCSFVSGFKQQEKTTFEKKM